MISPEGPTVTANPLASQQFGPWTTRAPSTANDGSGEPDRVNRATARPGSCRYPDPAATIEPSSSSVRAPNASALGEKAMPPEPNDGSSRPPGYRSLATKPPNGGTPDEG